MGRVIAIINPAAGRGHGARLRPLVLAELARRFSGLEVAQTTRPGHATELARQAVGADLVIAVGGDGTVREVVAGLAGTTTQLAIIPTGSGNDFLKTIGIPADPFAACRIAAEGRPRPVDAVRIQAAGDGTERTLVYANAAGFGFDAKVAGEARRYKRLRGLPLYVAAVFRTVGEYQCPLVRISVNGRTWEQRILLIAAGNGRFYGGGMRIAPDAAADDGLLDICVCDALDRLTIYRYLPRLIKGTHVTLEEVAMLRAAKLGLDFLEPVMFQLDGDLQPDQGLRRFTLEVLPAALRVLVP